MIFYTTQGNAVDVIVIEKGKPQVEVNGHPYIFENGHLISPCGNHAMKLVDTANKILEEYTKPYEVRSLGGKETVFGRKTTRTEQILMSDGSIKTIEENFYDTIYKEFNGG